jgi:Eco57I restriction-modification methylase/Type I restriction enzyme R protein N terminus (HSDR_N)/TaqI-like C-terminal specificity domain/N-6 DNA Methylase
MPSQPSIATFKDESERLVEVFHKNLPRYKDEGYDESSLRTDFLNPFWRALGWDIENRNGLPQQLREVQVETRVDVGGKKKRADYIFRTDGIEHFVCEAKKPQDELNTRGAYQAQRYAFNLKLHVCTLTNFEKTQFFVLGGKPEKDSPWEAGKQWHYADYPGKSQELWDLFARSNVADFSLERFVAGLPKRSIANRKRQGWLIPRERVRTVDTQFLAYIEEQRKKLADSLVAENRSHGWERGALLNECVQRILDRILFVRICEDRDIDTGRTLERILADWDSVTGVGKPSLYSLLVKQFNSLDPSFNGALFRKGHESERLKIPDRFLSNLIMDLSSEDSPYLFNTLPVEILGSVYERFIGKAIHVSGESKVKAELKPELRKTEGVYYTPRFIVNFIVEQTVGRLTEGKSPKDIAKLRFLDPSCGSGSFLLRVFERICEYHLRWFQQNPAHQKPELCYKDEQNALQLTTHLKRQIMLNNVFGVDLDHQAVEVTMLSLYLKILEGETRTTLGKQQGLFPKETFLPDLSKNIKCGNSLVGPDFYEGEQLSLLHVTDSSRVNAFDWATEFPAVSEGGFDAIVGNPPYVRIQTLREIRPEESEYFKPHYASATKGNFDIYVLFVEKGLSLLKNTGLMGYILPSKFLATNYGQPLRRLLSDRQAVSKVVDFRHEQVFDGATTYTCLLFLAGKPVESIAYSIASPPMAVATEELKQQVISAKELSERPWTFGSSEAAEITRKLSRNSASLLELPALISRGSSSGADDVFILKRSMGGFQARDGSAVELEDGILRTPIYATDFGRYSFHPAGEEKIIFPYKVTSDGYALLSEQTLRSEFPKTYAYLASRKKELKRRKQFSEWYSFSAPRNLNVHDHADLAVPLLADRGLFCQLPKKKTAYCLMASGGFSISIKEASGYSGEYVLAILNSKLMFWHLRKMSNVFRGGWITCTKQYVGTLPVRRIDRSKPVEVGRHDSLVAAVKQMIALKVELLSAKTNRQTTAAQRQISATETRMNQLVYELYGLTAQEAEIIEDASKNHEESRSRSIVEQMSLV